MEAGLSIYLTSKTVIRLAPPVNIPAELWDEGAMAPFGPKAVPEDR